MSNEIQVVNKQTEQLSPEVISSLVLNGDLAKLTPTQKVSYYNNLCARIGLDPSTQPFKLMKLNGKEVMYADKGATQQLSGVYHISHQLVSKERIDDIYVATVRATMTGGRFTDEVGAVTIAGLKGDSLANAIMKAITKAKRRAVLALVGLGMLDESELETIASVVKVATPIVEPKAQITTVAHPVKPNAPVKAEEVMEVACSTVEKGPGFDDEGFANIESSVNDTNPTEDSVQLKEGQKLVEGILAKHFPPTGKGPHSFSINRTYYKTFDHTKAEVLAKMVGQVVRLSYIIKMYKDTEQFWIEELI